MPTIRKSSAAKVSKPDVLPLRFRASDSPAGVTRQTLSQAAKQLGMTETALIHLALRRFIRDELPSYDADVPPLTPSEIQAVRKLVPQDVPGRVLSKIAGA